MKDVEKVDELMIECCLEVDNEKCAEMNYELKSTR